MRWVGRRVVPRWNLSQAKLFQDPSCSRTKRVPEVDIGCRFLIVSLVRGSSRFESLISSHHFSVACECNEEGINGDDDECRRTRRGGLISRRSSRNASMRGRLSCTTVNED